MRGQRNRGCAEFLGVPAVQFGVGFLAAAVFVVGCAAADLSAAE
ncbi:hypothetical protein [Amycolatopsis echigonensis]|nr:hypothetical protein [Amycolatopsis niigatensis]